MSDFKSFQNQYRKPEPAKESGRAGGKNDGKIPLDPKTVTDFAKQYENSSEQEVLSDLLKAAKQGKENGTFDINQIEQFAGNLSGVLNDQQKKRLSEVLKMMKNT